MNAAKTYQQLLAENEQLNRQLAEAAETLTAIRTGQVDAFVVQSREGHELYTLKTANQTYRVFIETMNEGAVTLNVGGLVIYSNSMFASMIGLPLSRVTGEPFSAFAADESAPAYADLFALGWAEDHNVELFIRGQNLPPDSLRQLEKTIHAAQRMERTIVDILTYLGLSTNTDRLVPTDLTDLVTDVLADFDLTISGKRAVVRVGPLPVVAVNQGQMRQVFQNLINNALKFSRPGVPPEISISAESNLSRADAGLDSAYCTISVTDNGIGFDEQYAATVFSLFHRLNTKDAYEGSGIGLTIPGALWSGTTALSPPAAQKVSAQRLALLCRFGNHQPDDYATETNHIAGRR